MADIVQAKDKQGNPVYPVTTANAVIGLGEEVQNAVSNTLGGGSISGVVTQKDIADMETKTHAAATYQPKGSYLTSQDITGKADKSTTYTKTEVDTALGTKASKTEVEVVRADAQQARESASAAESSASSAEASASSAASSASSARGYAGSIQNTLDTIVMSGNIPDATVAQVTLNTGKLSELASKVGEIANSGNNADLDINDEKGNTLVRFEDGGVKTKNFDSKTTPSIGDDDLADLDILDEDGYIIARIGGGHIKTKNFDSSNIPSGGGFKYPHYNVIGSSVPFIPQIDTTGLTTFTTLEGLYNAYDALVTSYPSSFKREADIGMDESNTYPIRHYTIRNQYPLVTDDRGATGTNRWDDTSFKYRRIMLNIGIHPNEIYATLGGYLAVKAILESTDQWAMFIKSNFIIDVIPMYNVYGMANGRISTNVNGINLNRDFRSKSQNETKVLSALIDDLITKGLVGIIDFHNTQRSIELSGESYFVTKTTYTRYNYYCVLTQQIDMMFSSLLSEVMGTSNKNHFHTWNYISEGATNVGQLHEYCDTMGLLGCSFEVATGAGLKGSIASMALGIAILQAFGTYEGN